MMKKFLSLILALTMAASLAACGGEKKDDAPAPKDETKTEAPAAPPEPSKEEVLLTEIRDLLKQQNKK